MRILAIETAVPPGSIWAGELPGDPATLRCLESTRRTTELFSVAVRSALDERGWRANSIELVAASLGPGSFTGLRIGITAAKTFAYAVGCEILAVNTLELIARQATYEGEIVAVLDAQRGQVFAATFEWREAQLHRRSEIEILDNQACCARLAAHQLITGPGVKQLTGHLIEHPLVGDENSWIPRADTLAKSAIEKHLSGERHDLWTLHPRYFRKSAAEEKAGRKLVEGM